MNTASPVLRSSLILALVIGGLSVVDRFLAQADMAEVETDARQAFTAGSRLLEQGKAPESVDLLRKAHVLDRRNPEYELALGNALLTAGKADEAQPLIDEALNREPNDGRANLIAARLAAQNGMAPEAKAYYHRAIYGNWPGNPAERRVAARMELTAMLVRENNRMQLLPELISLEGETAGNAEIQRRVARDFMLAGSPARAAALYRDLTEKNPQDAGLFEGWGEAELEQGQYRLARFAFLKALSIGRDPAVQPRLELLNRLNALDPTPRQLPSLEKYRRSIRILREARDDLAEHPSADTDALVREADTALSALEPAHATNEMAEAVLALAGKLWQYRVKTFGGQVRPEGEALRLIMEKLAA